MRAAREADTKDFRVAHKPTEAESQSVAEATSVGRGGDESFSVGGFICG